MFIQPRSLRYNMHPDMFGDDDGRPLLFLPLMQYLSVPLLVLSSSRATQQAFHKRITFCLDVHNEAVKSMRFPATSYKDITAEER